MKIAAIPTKYKGVQFRSRLEARWAAFFDCMKWTWHYEPLDLNGWIPDFIIGDNLETGAYVEIKPIDFQPLCTQKQIQPYLDSNPELTHARKTVPATARGLAFLGLRPFNIMEEWGGNLLAVAPVWEPKYQRYLVPSFYRGYGLYDVTVGSRGIYPGLMTGLDFEFRSDDSIETCWSDETIMALWNEAGNKTQWRSPVH